MTDFSLTTHIDAPPGRVWRALCDPNEVVRWDAGVYEALDAPAGYPMPGQHVRWRLRSGPFRLLHDRPQHVEPNRRLHSHLDIGPYHLDETYTLHPDNAGTRLDTEVGLTVRIPLLCPLVDRFYAARAFRRDFAQSLRNLKRHCESNP